MTPRRILWRLGLVLGLACLFGAPASALRPRGQRTPITPAALEQLRVELRAEPFRVEKVAVVERWTQKHLFRVAELAQVVQMLEWREDRVRAVEIVACGAAPALPALPTLIDRLDALRLLDLFPDDLDRARVRRCLTSEPAARQP